MEKRPSVLIIEPQHNTRTTLELTLSHEGLRVFSAVTFDSALLQLRILQPDLIIIGFDGQEPEESVAVAQIRVLSAAPLLALRPADATGALPGPGITDTLLRPLSVEQFCAKVAMLLDRQRSSYSA